MSFKFCLILIFEIELRYLVYMLTGICCFIGETLTLKTLGNMKLKMTLEGKSWKMYYCPSNVWISQRSRSAERSVCVSSLNGLAGGTEGLWFCIPWLCLLKRKWSSWWSKGQTLVALRFTICSACGLLDDLALVMPLWASLSSHTLWEGGAPSEVRVWMSYQPQWSTLLNQSFGSWSKIRKVFFILMFFHPSCLSGCGAFISSNEEQGFCHSCSVFKNKSIKG